MVMVDRACLTGLQTWNDTLSFAGWRMGCKASGFWRFSRLAASLRHETVCVWIRPGGLRLQAQPIWR